MSQHESYIVEERGIILEDGSGSYPTELPLVNAENPYTTATCLSEFGEDEDTESRRIYEWGWNLAGKETAQDYPPLKHTFQFDLFSEDFNKYKIRYIVYGWRQVRGTE